MTAYIEEMVAASPLGAHQATLAHLTTTIIEQCSLGGAEAIRTLAAARVEHYKLAQQMRSRMVADLHVIGNLSMQMLGEQLGISDQMVSHLRDGGPQFYVLIWRTAAGYVMDVEKPVRTVIRTRITDGAVPVPSRFFLDELGEEHLRAHLDLPFWYERLREQAVFTA